MEIFSLVRHYLNTTLVNQDTPYFVVLADGVYMVHYYKDNKSWKEYRNCFSVMDIESENATYASYLNFGKEYHPHVEFIWANESTLRALRKESIQLDIDKALESTDDTNIKLIKKEVEEDKGKVVKFDARDIPEILLCAVSSDEDYYYVGIDMDMNLHYSSCVGGYKLVDDESICETYNEWYIDNKQKIQDELEKQLKDGFDVPFTDIHL